MRIAQVVPLHIPVPPQSYGGTERCVANLTEALCTLGHDVTLFASGDSKTRAELVPFVPEAIGFDLTKDWTAYHIALLAEVYRQADRFDVIHSHLDCLTLPFAQQSTTPTVMTLHGRLDREETIRAFQAYPRANLVAISESQRSQIPEVNWVATVHHSVDVSDFTFYPKMGDYLAFVGRISPDKRPDIAIEVANMTGEKLKIAAQIDPRDKEYHEELIVPLLKNNKNVEFLGTLDEAAKRDLIGNAKALLLPIDWPEPFGMVFIEALASGTPVLTRPMGSVPELLKDGVTGYIRSTTEGLARAVTKLHHIDRRACREYALKRFDIARMALDYVNVYNMVQNRRKLFTLAAEPSDQPDGKVVLR